ncbi:MAG: hypothetical protein ACOYB4_08690 [Methyloceanibacter sp.]
MSTRFISLAIAGGLLGAFALLPVPASAGPSGIVQLSPDASLTQHVGYERRRYKRRYYRDDDVHVRAPFTSVDDTARGTAVDAPFTSVRTGRRGTWVRAPFVNLFVPRY